MKIKLPNNLFTLVDASDFEFLSQFNWYIHEKYVLRDATVKERDEGYPSLIRMSRVIMFGMSPTAIRSKRVVDHIDGDRLDNRRSNLRITTQSNNRMGKCVYKNNTSGYRGVTIDPKSAEGRKWKARIQVRNKRIVVGWFPTPQDACRALNEEIKRRKLSYHRIQEVEEVSPPDS